MSLALHFLDAPRNQALKTIQIFSHMEIAHDCFKTCGHTVSHHISIFGLGVAIGIAATFVDFFFFFRQDLLPLT